MRLEVRVVVWMTALLGAAAAIALATMARLETIRMEEHWSEAGQLVARTATDALKVSMLNDAPEDIRRSVRDVEEGRLIEAVTVYRRTGVPWVSSEPGLAVTEPVRAALMTSMDQNRTIVFSREGVLSVFVPVPNEPECVGCHSESSDVLGAVEVRLDERPFGEDLARSARISLVVAGVPLLIGIVLSVWGLRRSVLRPLVDIGRAAERLGRGDLSVRLPRYRGWEFGEVAAAFNEMAARLEGQALDLRAASEQLRAELESMEEIQALLTSGAGLAEVLGRAAGKVAGALSASGVAVWRRDREGPQAVWGAEVPDGDLVARAADEAVVHTSAGVLGRVPEPEPIAWAYAPACIGGRCHTVVGIVWDPPKPLSASERELIGSLANLVGIAVRNAELLEHLQEKEQVLQGLLRKTLTVQEEERRRLSRELHDETSQVLSALMMNIDLLGSQAPVDEEARARIAAVKSLAEEAARNLDRMLLELRPALLEELGLVPALRWYVAQVGDLWGLPIEFEGGKVGRLPEHIELAAFRIAQEAVSNAARHARPSRVNVRVTVEDGRLRLEVTDDGVGFDVAEVASRTRAGEAVGLEGMRERAEIVGGTFRVDSVPGRGTRVVAELPFPTEDVGPTEVVAGEGGDET